MRRHRGRAWWRRRDWVTRDRRRHTEANLWMDQWR